jgi:anti-sigma factor RsiW
MNCDRIQSLLPMAVDRTMDESSRAEILHHAQHCPVCQQTLHKQEKLSNLIHDAAQRQPPPLYFEGVLAEIHRKMPVQCTAKAWRQRHRRWEAQQAATAFVSALAAIWLFSIFGVFDSNGLFQYLTQKQTPRFVSGLTVQLIRLPGTSHWVPKDSPLLQMSKQEYMDFRDCIFLHENYPMDDRRRRNL